MVDVDELCSVIKESLAYYAKGTTPYQQFRTESIFDDVQRRYALISIGRDQLGKRIHHCFVHVDVVDGKAIVLANNMLPTIKEVLVAAGVPAEQITVAINTDFGFSPLASSTAP